MSTEQLRLAIVAILVVIVAFGMYIGWHVTHPAQPNCSVGSALVKRNC